MKQFTTLLHLPLFSLLRFCRFVLQRNSVPLYACLFFINPLFAQQTPPVLVYADSTTRIETSPYAAVLEDAKGEWTIEQVMAMPDSCFHWSNMNRLNLGNSASRFWVRFYVDNKTHEDVYFLNALPVFYYLDMYVVNEAGHLVSSQLSGTLRPFESRSIPIHRLNFNLGKKPKVLFVAVKTDLQIIFPNYVGSQRAISYFNRLDERVFFFAFGLLFILAIYSLTIYFNSRDKPFLWYALYELGLIYFYLHYTGIGYEHLWQAFPWVNADSNFNIAASVIPGCLFSMSFLNTRNIIPKYHLYLKIVAITYCLGLLFEPLGFVALANVLAEVLIFILFFSLWLAAYLVYVKQHCTARFYLIGWGIYLVSVVIMALTVADVIPQFDNFVLDNYIIIFGAATEASFLAFALADRIREIRQQARDTQLLLLKQTEKYEHLVQQQTLLLEENLQLEQQNKPENKAELTELVRKMRTEQSLNRRLSVPTTEGVLWIPTQDIIRLEAMRSYCSIHLTNGKRLVASHPLSDFEKQLDTVEFMRVHKSHLVNMSQIQEYIRGEGGSLVLKDGSSVSVSRATKQAVLERLGI